MFRNTVRQLERELLDAMEDLAELITDGLDPAGAAGKRYPASDYTRLPAASLDISINHDIPLPVLEIAYARDEWKDPQKPAVAEERPEEPPEFLRGEAWKPVRMPQNGVSYAGFVIHRVPRYQLGYHVLGRAFPYLGVVEIASDLYGEEFEEVKLHETLHMRHPEKSEGEIRRMTHQLLPWGSKWN